MKSASHDSFRSAAELPDRDDVTPPAPDMEVVREWETALVNLGPNWEGIEKAIEVANSMSAALSAQARKIEGLERQVEDLGQGLAYQESLIPAEEVARLQDRATLAETQRDAAREALKAKDTIDQEWLAEAIARAQLTPLGKAKCTWPDEWGPSERETYRRQAAEILLARASLTPATPPRSTGDEK